METMSEVDVVVSMFRTAEGSRYLTEAQVMPNGASASVAWRLSMR